MIKEIITGVTAGAISLTVGGSDVRGNGPFTEHQVRVLNGLDPMTAPACQDNPNTSQDERASQDCLKVWNMCNGNAQKPANERVVGCFEGNIDIVYDEFGRIVDYTPTLTGYNTLKKGSVLLFTPKK